MILNNYFTDSSFTFVQRVNQVDVFFLRLHVIFPTCSSDCLSPTMRQTCFSKSTRGGSFSFVTCLFIIYFILIYYLFIPNRFYPLFLSLSLLRQSRDLTTRWTWDLSDQRNQPRAIEGLVRLWVGCAVIRLLNGRTSSRQNTYFVIRLNQDWFLYVWQGLHMNVLYL